MIQVGTILKVTDKSGVLLVRCLKVLGSSKNSIGSIGDVVLVSVLRIDNNRLKKMKLFKRKKFYKGTLQRGLIIRTKLNYKRFHKIFIKFSENTIVLVNKRIVPISNRIYGPVLVELCRKYPSIGSITRYFI